MNEYAPQPRPDQQPPQGADFYAPQQPYGEQLPPVPDNQQPQRPEVQSPRRIQPEVGGAERVVGIDPQTGQLAWMRRVVRGTRPDGTPIVEHAKYMPMPDEVLPPLPTRQPQRGQQQHPAQSQIHWAQPQAGQGQYPNQQNWTPTSQYPNMPAASEYPGDNRQTKPYSLGPQSGVAPYGHQQPSGGGTGYPQSATQPEGRVTERTRPDYDDYEAAFDLNTGLVTHGGVIGESAPNPAPVRREQPTQRPAPDIYVDGEGEQSPLMLDGVIRREEADKRRDARSRQPRSGASAARDYDFMKGLSATGESPVEPHVGQRPDQHDDADDAARTAKPGAQAAAAHQERLGGADEGDGVPRAVQPTEFDPEPGRDHRPFQYDTD